MFALVVLFVEYLYLQCIPCIHQHFDSIEIWLNQWVNISWIDFKLIYTMKTTEIQEKGGSTCFHWTKQGSCSINIGHGQDMHFQYCLVFANFFDDVVVIMQSYCTTKSDDFQSFKCLLSCSSNENVSRHFFAISGQTNKKDRMK